MSTFHVRGDVRPRVGWAIGYAAAVGLATPAVLDLDAVPARHGAVLLHALDAVCEIAPAHELPFADFAELDGLCADLADWLAAAPAEQALAA